MLRSLPKLNHFSEPFFSLFSFHSPLEKLPMELDNKIKAYFCIMKSTFFFSEDNLGQTDKVQNCISGAAKASESPFVLIRKNQGMRLSHSHCLQERGWTRYFHGAESLWDQNSQKCFFVHVAPSHFQSMPALQTETFLGADKLIYRNMNTLTH